jgi:hypothetical protein
VFIVSSGDKSLQPPSPNQIPTLSAIHQELYLFVLRGYYRGAQQNVHGAQIYVHFGKDFHGSGFEALSCAEIIGSGLLG